MKEIKKKSKIVLSLLFVIMFIVQLAIGAFSETPETHLEESGPTRYTNISSYYCDCYISGITLYASASLHAKRSMSLHITIELQKLSGSSYSTIKTWSDSETAISMDLSGSKLINVFSTYRIKVTYNAGGETVTAYDYA